MKAILLLLTLLYYIKPSNSYSACDSIDAIFLIDADTIRDNLDGISEFIESIIHHGSSEDLGISLYLYGDDIIPAQELKLVDTFDTFRYNKSLWTLNHLENEFISCISTDKSTKDSISVSLKDAFISSTQQQQPAR